MAAHRLVAGPEHCGWEIVPDKGAHSGISLRGWPTVALLHQQVLLARVIARSIGIHPQKKVAQAGQRSIA